MKSVTVGWFRKWREIYWFLGQFVNYMHLNLKYFRVKCQIQVKSRVIGVKSKSSCKFMLILSSRFWCRQICNSSPPLWYSFFWCRCSDGFSADLDVFCALFVSSGSVLRGDQHRDPSAGLHCDVWHRLLQPLGSLHSLLFLRFGLLWVCTFHWWLTKHPLHCVRTYVSLLPGSCSRYQLWLKHLTSS